MSESFNRDGPVKVSQTDFDAYQTIFSNGKPSNAKISKQPAFDSLVKIWLDERRSDGVRRLAIRDAIRQPFGCGSHSNKFTYYQTDMSLGRLDNILFDSRDKYVHFDLRYRPKLLDEIVSEFLYTLKHDRFLDRSRDQSNVDRFISHLIRLTDEPTGRLLIPYHSIWKVSPFHEIHTEFMLNDIVDSSLPAWLRNDLWTALQTHLHPEIAECQKALKSGPLQKKPNKPATSIYNLTYIHHLPIGALLSTGQFIGRYSCKPSESDIDENTSILQFLEKQLPSRLTYAQGHEMIRIAPRLSDDATAFDFARRHVLGEPDKTLSFMTTDWHLFLYWLRGLTTATHPDDAELLAEIDRCLVEIRSLSEK